MTTKATKINLVRADGKMGVDFDSHQTLQIFLDFVRMIGEASTKYFIPVLENNGIIPNVNPDNDGYDANFAALLTRMGVMPYDIPNSMRSYFLVTFQGGNRMQMTWWETTPSDRRQDFITYLKKVSRMELFDSRRQKSQKEMISNLIIPTLEEGEGFIPEDMYSILNLAQCWDMTNWQLANTILKLWKKMTQRLNAQAAGLLVGRSANTMRRWARTNKIHADVDHQGHWSFTREILIDCLI